MELHDQAPDLTMENVKLFLRGPLAPAASGVLMGPMSGWLMTAMDHRLGLDGWQWMFLLEAVPALAVSTLVLCLLSEHPTRARWLTPIEREVIEHNIAEDLRQMPEARPASLWAAMREPRVFVLGFTYAMVAIACYCIPFNMPLIISQLGVDSVRDIGVYSALPYFVGGGSHALVRQRLEPVVRLPSTTRHRSRPSTPLVVQRNSD